MGKTVGSHAESAFVHKQSDDAGAPSLCSYLGKQKMRFDEWYHNFSKSHPTYNGYHFATASGYIMPSPGFKQ